MDSTLLQYESLLVKPGITCYMQTGMKRDVIGYNGGVGLVLIYINQCNAWSDFGIVIQATGCVLTVEGS